MIGEGGKTSEGRKGIRERDALRRRMIGEGERQVKEGKEYARETH